MKKEKKTSGEKGTKGAESLKKHHIKKMKNNENEMKILIICKTAL